MAGHEDGETLSGSSEVVKAFLTQFHRRATFAPPSSTKTRGRGRMKCPRCQQENPPQAKFCLECATSPETYTPKLHLQPPSEKRVARWAEGEDIDSDEPRRFVL